MRFLANGFCPGELSGLLSGDRTTGESPRAVAACAAFRIAALVNVLCAILWDGILRRPRDRPRSPRRPWRPWRPRRPRRLVLLLGGCCGRVRRGRCGLHLQGRRLLHGLRRSAGHRLVRGGRHRSHALHHSRRGRGAGYRRHRRGRRRLGLHDLGRRRNRSRQRRGHLLRRQTGRRSDRRGRRGRRHGNGLRRKRVELQHGLVLEAGRVLRQHRHCGLGSRRGASSAATATASCSEAPSPAASALEHGCRVGGAAYELLSLPKHRGRVCSFLGVAEHVNDALSLLGVPGARAHQVHHGEARLHGRREAHELHQLVAAEERILLGDGVLQAP
mmetsp:Transcript_9737/g.36568  ORF Transcript_9737/g.36568 Transcript_9737/m.36568 type:complete len:331 (-) Transcript_9737:320-1312(-)